MPWELAIGFVVGLLLGAVVAGLLVYFHLSSLLRSKLSTERLRTAEAEDEATQLRIHRNRAENDVAALRAMLRESEIKAARAETGWAESKKQCDSFFTEIRTLRENLRRFEVGYRHEKTKVAEAERHVAEQRQLLEEARAQLSDAFGALAQQALGRNSEEFLKLAEAKFSTLKETSTSDLEARKTAIETLLKPVNESLEAYKRETKELEERRLREIGAVGEQLKSVALSQSCLQAETNKLVTALKSPTVRGRWGEITLKRSAEIAGMSPYCDFVEQETAAGSNGRLRPDMIVRLPAKREVIIDSKVPLAGYLEALEAQSEDDRRAALMRHADQVKSHVDKLSSKDYWSQFPEAPEFVILFLPNDSFLSAAVDQVADLIEASLIKKVVLATPSTLIALLRAIEYGWKQHLAVENAGQITNLAQELSDRFATLVEHFQEIGGSLGKAVKSYNQAVSSFESRILPTSRRFKALGAGGKKDIEEVTAVSIMPRDASALLLDE